LRAGTISSARSTTRPNASQALRSPPPRSTPRGYRWRQRYHLNRAAHRIRSRKLHRGLDGFKQPFDLAVLVFGWSSPWRGPYVIYVDHTWRMMEKHWPSGLPPRNALTSLLKAEREAFHGARHVFTMTHAAAQSLVDDYGLPEHRVTPVGGGVNFDELPEPRPAGASKTILFVGREFVRKGGDVLVEAFRRVRERIPEARLQVVGVTADETDGGPGVEVLGDIADRAALSGLYRDAAVFCLPSRYEPYGFSLLEAMALGLPCVAAHGVAAHEIVVAGETGVVVPPDDPEALHDALAHLLENPAEAAAMGQAGRKRVETELNWDRVVDRMEPGLLAAVG
jgi:starch synthase